MATLQLDVPLEAQTKPNTCWHASALMIWEYWQTKTGRQGPMYTIPDMWSNDNAVKPSDFITLAKNVGLMEVPRASTYTSEDLRTRLGAYGPIWCAGFWYGPGHIIVLTGVAGEVININDPDGGVRKMQTIPWFNTKLSNQIPGCMMCKDPSAY